MLHAWVKPESIVRRQRAYSCFWDFLPILGVHYALEHAACCLSDADYSRAHTGKALRHKMILRHCHKPSGFSLVEFMIAIAIFGIMATVAAPNFRSWSRNYQLKSASNDLHAHMQMAKIGAVKENVPWTLNFNQDGISGYNVKNGSGRIVKTVDFGAKYNKEIQYKSPTSSAQYDSPTLTFNPNGTSSSGFAYISNRKISGYYKVGLAFPNGSITLQKWDGSQWK